MPRWALLLKKTARILVIGRRNRQVQTSARIRPGKLPHSGFYVIGLAGTRISVYSAAPMIEDTRDIRMVDFQAVLDRWMGRPARLWTLSSGYPTLKIILFGENDEGSLEIVCVAPARIESQHRWEDSAIRVEKSDGGLFNVVDLDGGLRVTECGVQLKEFGPRPYLMR